MTYLKPVLAAALAVAAIAAPAAAFAQDPQAPGQHADWHGGDGHGPAPQGDRHGADWHSRDDHRDWHRGWHRGPNCWWTWRHHRHIRVCR